MMSEILEKSEKKVEYLELIYDLIFVYIIGRNNSLLHYLDGGSISGGMFIAYVVCSLAVIQIWNFSAYYINIFGKNGLREHIFLFLNMFLLYFIAEGTGRKLGKSLYSISCCMGIDSVEYSRSISGRISQT